MSFRENLTRIEELAFETGALLCTLCAAQCCWRLYVDDFKAGIQQCAVHLPLGEELTVNESLPSSFLSLALLILGTSAILCCVYLFFGFTLFEGLSF